MTFSFLFIFLKPLRAALTSLAKLTSHLHKAKSALWQDVKPFPNRQREMGHVVVDTHGEAWLWSILLSRGRRRGRKWPPSFSQHPNMIQPLFLTRSRHYNNIINICVPFTGREQTLSSHSPSLQAFLRFS